MGLIRGAFLIFVCILLFISLFLTGFFATLNFSLEYDSAKLQVDSVVKQVVDEKVDKTLVNYYENILEAHCNTNSEYVFRDKETAHTFIIPCEVISQGPEKIIESQAESLFEESYYQKYECDFWKCFKELNNPLFLVSEHAKDYWKSKYYSFLFVSILLAGLVFLLVERKTNFPVLTGILLILAFLPVSVLDSIGKIVFKLVLSSVKNAVSSLGSVDLSSLVLVFVSRANDVFLTGLIIGLVLIAFGIFLKLLNVGFKIGHFFKFDFGAKKRESNEIKKNQRKVFKER